MGVSATNGSCRCRGCDQGGSSFYAQEGKRLLVNNIFALSRNLAEGRITEDQLSTAIFLFMESEEVVCRAISEEALRFDHCCDEHAEVTSKLITAALELAKKEDRLSFHPMAGAQAVDWPANEVSWGGVAKRLELLGVEMPELDASKLKPYHKVAYSSSGFAIVFAEHGRVAKRNGETLVLV